MDTEDRPTLEGRTVAINGATGNVGEGIARAFLQAGARVLALGRSRARLDELGGLLKGEATERLELVEGDTGSFAGFEALAERLAAEHGPLDHAVSSVGGWWSGKRVWEVTEEEFDTYFAGVQRLHFAAARALAPRMAAGGSLTFVAGLSAIMPFAGVSLVGTQGAAQLMLARELQADAGDSLRVNSVVLGVVVSRDRREGKPGWITADDVGRAIVRVAASGLRGQELRLDDQATVQRSLAEAGA